LVWASLKDYEKKTSKNCSEGGIPIIVPFDYGDINTLCSVVRDIRTKVREL
jgi:hypothetical protein